MLPRILYSLQQTTIYYVVIAGLFSALWLWWRKRPGKRKPLQAAPVQAAQIRRELFTSIGSIIVFSSYLPILLLYSLFWARMMGTLSPDYEEQYKAKW